MSWLSNLFSKTTVTKLEQAQEAVVTAMPSFQCAVAVNEEPESEDNADADSNENSNDNSAKQRRYFVKTGTYVDNEEERAAARKAATPAEEIRDRQPVDLKTLF